SIFDIRILTAVMMLRQHVELPKSNTELLGQRTSCWSLVIGISNRCRIRDAGYRMPEAPVRSKR
ncbi:MAG: hypothetical protein KAT27_01265, partial [Desulfobacterales bacterium]|nr:hypothetical protein [Desulfobacterales bacterium]